MKTPSDSQLTGLVVLSAVALSSATLLAANPRAHDMRGTIKSVDANAHTLVITDHKDKSDQTFQWNDQTRFVEHGKSTTASELKAGERVQLHYSASGDQRTLQRVHIVPATGEKSTYGKS
jgi:Cu/Ag efflux protein CusF